ncbi:MAG: argininosuccinate synthase [Peptoniphilaceae bacterium]|nr:argininosuccinate synthase [Peptoniphilaceae bacterium]MDY3738635.1 argininosuccinate synthase [Peptoniphilaceae bacterium]
MKYKKEDINKVVLAYSGGLDTSIIINWLIENYECEVIAVAADVGQNEELDGLKEKALKSGASKYYQLDLTEEFIEDYVFEALKASAKYENQYYLGTAFARPLIGKKLVEIAHKENADAIVHGCTGKGNDQVRFETSIRAFDADIPIIAPWRIWEIKSREEEVEYATNHNIPLNGKNKSPYSEDRNLWHISHEGLDLEKPENEPDYKNMLTLCKTPKEANDFETYVTIEFDKGIPIAIDGVKMNGVELVKKLNELGQDNGIGINDIVENRLVGMKVRGVYENPAAEILYKAHHILETLTLERDTQHYKQKVSLDFAELVYNGLWYTTLRESLSAFVDKTQETVTGVVKLKLYKGNVINAGVFSKYTLYDEEYATFGEDGVYDQTDSQGFVNLYALPIKVHTMMKNNLYKKENDETSGK